MKQSTLDYEPVHDKTFKEAFLEEMKHVVLLSELVVLIQQRTRGVHLTPGRCQPIRVCEYGHRQEGKPK